MKATKINRDLQQVVGCLQLFNFLFSLCHPFLILFTPRCLNLKKMPHCSKSHRGQVGGAVGNLLDREVGVWPFIVRETWKNAEGD